jgi:ribosome-binding factor A
MNERRLHRLESQIKARIAEILLRDLQDPKIGMVTISRVELDSEFTQCKVFWSVLGDHGTKAATERALTRARGFIQREMGTALHTRTVPHLQFHFDESIAGALKMQQTLDDLRRERELRTGEVEPPAPEGGQPPRS